MSYKTYRWNRNAATHRDALTRFAVMGFMAAGVMGVFVSVGLLPQERTDQTYTIAAAGMLLVILSTWVIVTGFLTWSYWALNEAQFKPEPPPEKHPPTPLNEKKPVAYFANGKYQGDI